MPKGGGLKVEWEGGERSAQQSSGGDGQRTTFGKGQVAQNASLRAGTASLQGGLSPELLLDGHLWIGPTSSQGGIPTLKQGTATSPPRPLHGPKATTWPRPRCSPPFPPQKPLCVRGKPCGPRQGDHTAWPPENGRLATETSCLGRSQGDTAALQRNTAERPEPHGNGPPPHLSSDVAEEFSSGLVFFARGGAGRPEPRVLPHSRTIVW